MDRADLLAYVSQAGIRSHPARAAVIADVADQLGHHLDDDDLDVLDVERCASDVRAELVAACTPDDSPTDPPPVSSFWHGLGI